MYRQSIAALFLSCLAVLPFQASANESSRPLSQPAEQTQQQSVQINLNTASAEVLYASGAATDLAQAQSLSADLKPLASRLVITRLTAGGAEIFAHQIECQGREGDTVTVLVNAITGAQEKIIVSRGDET